MSKKKTLPNIHLACSDDELRPALACVEIKNGIATATDAHVLAQMNLNEYSLLLPEVIKKLDGKLIHRDIWAEIIDADLIDLIDDDTLNVKKGSIECNYRLINGLKYPNYSDIIRSVANSKFAQKSFVAFNPKLIALASKLFPSENLICRFYIDHDMMIFFLSGDAKGFVGVMPLIIDDSNAVLDFSLS